MMLRGLASFAALSALIFSIYFLRLALREVPRGRNFREAFPDIVIAWCLSACAGCAVVTLLHFWACL